VAGTLDADLILHPKLKLLGSRFRPHSREAERRMGLFDRAPGAA